MDETRRMNDAFGGIIYLYKRLENDTEIHSSKPSWS